MPAHFIFCITHPTQGCVDRILADSPHDAAYRREQPTQFAGDCFEILEYCKRLSGKGHAVLTGHLHLLGRDDPFCFIEIKLFPLGMPEFSRPDKNKWSKPQRGNVVGWPSKPSIARNSAPIAIGSIM